MECAVADAWVCCEDSACLMKGSVDCIGEYYPGLFCDEVSCDESSDDSGACCFFVGSDGCLEDASSGTCE